MRYPISLFVATVLAAQNGPPELANPSRDPFAQNPLDRRPQAREQRQPVAISPEDAKRSREDLAKLLDLTAEVRKSMEKATAFTADVPTARRLEEIEKIAKRMRKRITR